MTAANAQLGGFFDWLFPKVNRQKAAEAFVFIARRRAAFEGMKDTLNGLVRAANGLQRTPELSAAIRNANTAYQQAFQAHLKAAQFAHDVTEAAITSGRIRRDDVRYVDVREEGLSAIPIVALAVVVTVNVALLILWDVTRQLRAIAEDRATESANNALAEKISALKLAIDKGVALPQIPDPIDPRNPPGDGGSIFEFNFGNGVPLILGALAALWLLNRRRM